MQFLKGKTQIFEAYDSLSARALFISIVLPKKIIGKERNETTGCLGCWGSDWSVNTFVEKHMTTA